MPQDHPVVLLVGTPGGLDARLAHLFGPGMLCRTETVKEAMKHLSSLPERSVIIMSDTVARGGHLRRAVLPEAAVRAGHDVLILTPFSNELRAALMPFAALEYTGNLDPQRSGELLDSAPECFFLTEPSARIQVAVLGPELLWSKIRTWMLRTALSTHPGLFATGAEEIFEPSRTEFAHVRAEFPVVGFKRGTVLINSQGELAVAGGFSYTPLPFECDARCPFPHEHPRGVSDPAAECYGGFSAHDDRLAALCYAPSDEALLHVELSGNVALAGTPRSQVAFNASHQRVVEVELLDACWVCSAVVSHLSGFEDSVLSAGWQVLRPTCAAHVGEQAMGRADLLGALAAAAGYPVKLSWIAPQVSGILLRRGRRQRSASRPAPQLP